ncbi:MAG: hypothetical protein CMN30_22305 [Sandaracinus sp.]|mgnify:CR=1 FL=1|nr:hypothetical protein [Sandaracinus sp.]
MALPGRLLGSLLVTLMGCAGSNYQLDAVPRVTTSVRVEAPSECALEGSLRRALGDHMGTVSFREDSRARVRMEVRLRRDSFANARWQARIRTLSENGEVLGVRELALPARSCDEARESLGFVVEMVVDTPAVAEAVEAAVRDEHDSEGDEPVGVYLGLAGGVTLGRAPSTGVSVGLETLVVWRPLELRVGGLALLPGQEGIGEGVGLVGAELTLEGCPAVDRGIARFAFCGGLRGGFLRAEGRGFDDNRIVTGMHVDGTLAFRPALRWRRLHVALGVDVGVPFVRPSFAFVHGGESVVLYVAGRVWGGVGLALGLRLR